MPRVKVFDKNEVLKKAMHLFWKQGYAATSIQDLVNHLGINRASLYDTYGGKEQLFKSSLELYRSTNLEGVTELLENCDNIKDGFTKLFANSINGAVCDDDKKGCFVVNTATELIPNNESLQEVLLENKNAFEAVFYKVLKKGRDNGQVSNKLDLESTAALLYTLFNGLQVVSKINANSEELSNSIKVALSLLESK